MINARNCIGAVLVLLALSLHAQAEDAVPTSIAVSPSQTSLFLNGSQTYTATVYDQFGAAIDSAVVTWDATGGTISSTGVYTAGITPGTYTITASVGTVQGLASVDLTNEAPYITSVDIPYYVIGISAAMSVSASDDAGEQNLTYSWSASGPGPVSFSDNGTNLAKNITATFGMAGLYVFSVVAMDAQGFTSTSTVSVPVYQMPTTLSVSPQSFSLPGNAFQTFTLALTDQFGFTADPNVFYITTSAEGGFLGITQYYSGFTPGVYSLTWTCGDAHASATAIVLNTPPTLYNISHDSTTAFTSSYMSAFAVDPDYQTLTYNWTAAGPSPVSFSQNGSANNYTVATFSAAGDYVFTLTVADPLGGTASQSFNVTVLQAPWNVIVTPSSVTMPLNGTQTFTSSATDQFGNAITVPPRWFANGILYGPSQTFTFSPLMPGHQGVAAVYGGYFAASSDVTVINSPPVITSLSAPTVVTGTTATFSITATDDGGESNLTYLWAAGNTNFSDNYSNSAKNVTATFNRAGSYYVQVMVRDPYFQATVQSFTVTVVQTPQITITAVYNGSPIPVFGQVGYVASAVDQFGQTVVGAPTWTATGGTITNYGWYTAGSVGGNFAVTAAFGSATASSPVTIIPGLISASVVNPPSNVNLTPEGTSDWAHWGLNNTSSFDHKINIPQIISDRTLLNTSTVSKTVSSPTFSWTDGTPNVTQNGTKNCVSVSGTGSGFQFTVQATQAVQTLNIYVGVAKATGKLQLSLSDNSAPVLIDTSITSSSTTVNKVYQVQFSSPYSATLTVNWTEQSGGNNGSVLLQAATLKQ